METKTVKISGLQECPGNYNTHPKEQIEELKKSLDQFSQYKNVVVWNGYIIAGNGLVMAAREMGLDEVTVTDRSELSEEQARALLIADNRTPALAVPDIPKLEELMEGIDPLTIPGVDAGWLEELGISFDSDETQDDDGRGDDIPEAEDVETRCKAGELWELGRHRLLCGDCTDPEAVARLMGGVKADMVFTDPPYGIDWDTDYKRFKGNHDNLKKYDKIAGDDKLFNPEYWVRYFDACLFFGANCFSDKLPLGSWIIWDKRHDSGVSFLADGEAAWFTGSGAVYIISEIMQGFLNSDGKRFHPTQKPVNLFMKIFEKIKVPDIVIDPFLGSGTTLIASEKTGRTCYGMEIDPGYCDIILKRFEDFTGEQAKCST